MLKKDCCTKELNRVYVRFVASTFAKMLKTRAAPRGIRLSLFLLSRLSLLFPPLVFIIVYSEKIASTALCWGRSPKSPLLREEQQMHRDFRPLSPSRTPFWSLRTHLRPYLTLKKLNQIFHKGVIQAKSVLRGSSTQQHFNASIHPSAVTLKFFYTIL